MITARMALEHNREVLALPGRIDSPLSRGPHHLLKQGAVLVDSIEDIVSSLGEIGLEMQGHVQASVEALAGKERAKRQPVVEGLTGTERLVYGCLGLEPLHADHISHHARLPVGKVTADLVALQLKGLVRSLPGNFFKRTS
jgi:DNA processing protein